MKSESELNCWIFSSKDYDYYGPCDWDLETIVKRKQYYLKHKEKCCTKIKPGDMVFLRIFGKYYIGTFNIGGPWIADKDWKAKGYEQESGAFPMVNLEIWERPLPQNLVIRELSNHNMRSRVIRINSEDTNRIVNAHRLYIL